jgi:hypothetical protein
MSSEQKLQLIINFNHLILRKTPGTASQLAHHLGISRSTFFRLLSYMKEELRAPIKYDEYRGAYIYETEGEIIVGFVKHQPLVTRDLQIFNGGSITSHPTFQSSLIICNSYLSVD